MTEKKTLKFDAKDDLFADFQKWYDDIISKTKENNSDIRGECTLHFERSGGGSEYPNPADPNLVTYETVCSKYLTNLMQNSFIENNGIVIESLILDGEIENKECVDSIIKILGNGSNNYSGLKSLVISGRSGGLIPDHGKMLAECLKTNKTLEVFKIKDCHGPFQSGYGSGMKNFLEDLADYWESQSKSKESNSSSSALREVSFRGISWTFEGVEYVLVDALKKFLTFAPPSLKILDMGLSLGQDPFAKKSEMEESAKMVLNAIGDGLKGQLKRRSEEHSGKNENEVVLTTECINLSDNSEKMAGGEFNWLTDDAILKADSFMAMVRKLTVLILGDNAGVTDQMKMMIMMKMNEDGGDGDDDDDDDNDDCPPHKWRGIAREILKSMPENKTKPGYSPGEASVYEVSRDMQEEFGTVENYNAKVAEAGSVENFIIQMREKDES